VCAHQAGFGHYHRRHPLRRRKSLASFPPQGAASRKLVFVGNFFCSNLLRGCFQHTVSHGRHTTHFVRNAGLSQREALPEEPAAEAGSVAPLLIRLAGSLCHVGRGRGCREGSADVAGYADRPIHRCERTCRVCLSCPCSGAALRPRRLTPLLDAIGCAALLHLHNRTVLQLYHGSTGAVMFRSGPVRTDTASATKSSTESPLPAGMLTAKRALWRLKFAAQILPKVRV
jgi:hypothetical protein